MEPKPMVLGKSYTAELKLKVCERAEIIGHRKTAREFGVDESNVRLWMKTNSILSKMKRRSLCGHGSKWPDLERELCLWIRDRREHKARVTGGSVR